MNAGTRAALLAFAAAYVDTVGFIGLFGLFTAHVTGNFVLIGAEFVNQHADVLTKLLALPVFVLSVALTAQMEIALVRRSAGGAAWLLGLEAALVAFAAVAPQMVGMPSAADNVAATVVGFLLVAAMGIQNTLMRTSLAGPVQTTVMTGNVTQLTIDSLALLTGRGDPTIRTRASRAWPSVLAFLGGSALGAIGYAVWKFDSLWCAAGVVAVAAWAHRRGPL